MARVRGRSVTRRGRPRLPNRNPSDRDAHGPALAEAGALLSWQSAADGGLHLALENGTAYVAIAEDGTVRVRGAGCDALPPSLLNPPDPPQGPRWRDWPAWEAAVGRTSFLAVEAETRSLRDGGVALVHSGREHGARVEVHAQPFSVEVRDGIGAAVAELRNFAFSGQAARVDLVSPPGERILGLGEKSGPLDRRGRSFTLRNQDADLDIRRDATYASIPFLLGLDPAAPGPAARGLLLDGFAPAHFDVAKSQPDRIRMRTEGGDLDLSLFPGPAPADVLRRFTARTGRAPLPPRWALGHHQSRWSYKSDRAVRRLAREIRRRGIPTDVIHLDIDYMDGFRVFTWDRKRFPDPKTLLHELRELGLHTVVIIDPGVKVDPDYGVYREGVEGAFFCRRRDGSRYTLRVWPKESALPDFNRRDVRAWWAELHGPLLDSGVAGIWNDMNEPAGWRRDLRLGPAILPVAAQDMRDVVQRDPVSDWEEERAGELEAEPDADPERDAEPATRAVPAGPARDVPHERVRNLYALQECRATRAALERFEPERRPFVLSRSGCAGIQRYAALWTGDSWSRWSHLRQTLPMLQNLSVSGVSFCGADIGGFAGSCSPELFARWIQIGALYPFARTHSMWLGRRQEPWRFGRRVEAVARSALELRMRLLPYLYDLFHRAEDSGAPVWRPLAFEFPNDPLAAAVDDQVMLGPSLLLAPVLERGARTRKLYLPRGVWWDWHSDARYRGPRRVQVDAPLDRLPIFARAGSLVPTQSPVRHTGETPEEPCVIEVFPGQDGAGRLVEDDGETLAYRARGDSPGAIATTPLRLRSHAGGRLRVELGRREGAFEIPHRPLRLVIHGSPRPDAVYVDGERLQESETPPGYQCRDGRTHVRLIDRGQASSLEIAPEP